MKKYKVQNGRKKHTETIYVAQQSVFVQIYDNNYEEINMIKGLNCCAYWYSGMYKKKRNNFILVRMQYEINNNISK